MAMPVLFQLPIFEISQIGISIAVVNVIEWY
ncbi:hypothetical protein BJB45_10425 [Halomonas huangheensis]|uniref:Uncharacterized protein n=1 Tax=Halomonas huangheensis TaxID=1178482 RepID=W1NA61_9GAMM|nr:hypothetical protein BJB45_10425 [Halomonas huangheensis]